MHMNSLTVFDPLEAKRESIKTAFGKYSANELMGIIKTVSGGMSMSVSSLIDKLARGEFDISAESPEARQTHMSLNGDLCQPFIECQKMLDVDIDINKIKKTDFLHDSWDMREPGVRKISKIKNLILEHAPDDPDLKKAITEIEWLYTNRK